MTPTPIDTDRINALIDYIADGIESGGDLAIQQAPIIAQDIVVYGRVSGATTVVGSTAIAVLLAWMTRKMWRLSEEAEYADGSVIWILGTAICSVGCIVALSVALTGSNLMAWVAPRLYVLNYLRDLIGG